MFPIPRQVQHIYAFNLPDTFLVYQLNTAFISTKSSFEEEYSNNILSKATDVIFCLPPQGTDN